MIRSITFLLINLMLCLLLLVVSSCKNDSAAKTIDSLSTSTTPCVAAAELAQRREKQAVEPLIELLKRHQDVEVQKCSAEAVAAIDIDGAVTRLIASLDDSDLLAASRAAFALGIIKDKRAVAPLQTAFLGSRLPCPAAIALGMIKDPSSKDLMMKAASHQDSSIRGCAIQALAYYGDVSVCGMLADIFMTDNDTGVRFTASAAKDFLKCPVTAASKYAIEDKYCKGAQKLIDVAIPLFNNTAGLKDWQANAWEESPQWRNAVAEILPELGTPGPQPAVDEKDFALRMSIYSAVSSWGGSMFHCRLLTAKDQKDEILINTRLGEIKLKREQLLQVCPGLRLPEAPAG